jgi:hypothetical protein
MILSSPTVVGMNTGQPEHVCFYSNKCKWSKAFLEELANTPWKQSFRFVCVDPTPGRPPIPSWLQKVPTLVIQGEQQPRTDGDVMNWLSEMKMKQGGSLGGGSARQDELEPYNMMEHQSFAKGFGYSGLDTDTSAQGNGGFTIPGAFSFLNGAAATGDRSANAIPSMADTAKRSRKEQMMDQQMEDYIKERNRGIPQGPPRA